MTDPSADGAIVVAYDGSAHAEAALDWAARTGALEGRHVRVVFVNDTDGTPSEADIDVQARVETVLKAAGASGTFEQLSGSAQAVLLQQARDAHVLVAGTRGRGRAAETLLGSVSQHLARHAPCTLIVVSPPASPEASRIVVGIDGSPESINALEFACHRASFTKEPVVALHAWKPGHVDLGYSGQLPEAVGKRSEAAEALLADSLEDVRGKYPDVTVEQDLVPLAPTTALTEASSRASLVVTGSRGRGMVTGLVLGSVSQHLLSHAHCPVAVTR